MLHIVLTLAVSVHFVAIVALFAVVFSPNKWGSNASTHGLTSSLREQKAA